MATTRINGSEQIKAGSVTHTEVDSSVIVAGGGNAYSGNQSMGGNKLTNLANGSASGDSVSYGQVQGMISTGSSTLLSVQAMTTGAETFIIASGSVTQISGTNVDGVTTWTIGDRILIKNAPSASGVGTVDSGNAGTDQPANGVYSITGTTTNLTVTRDTTSATPLSGTVNPSGRIVFCDEGTANKAACYGVVDPNSPHPAFTTATTKRQWGKFNASSGSVTTASVVTANGFAGTVANASSTPAITLTTSVTGVLKGNGTAISAATVGTDYLAPSSWVANETPSGSVNSSNTAFTLANTPSTNVTNPVMLYLNGSLLEPGSGNDFTISGSSITMLFAPATNDKMRAYYWK